MLRRIHLLLPIIIGLILMLFSFLSPVSAFTGTGIHNAFTPNSYYSNCLKVGNKLFVSYLGVDENYVMGIYSTEYTGTTWTNPVRVGYLDSMDAHGTPQMLRDSSGYLYVFYDASSGNMKVSKSNSTDSTNGWHAITTLSGAYTYPHPVINPTNNSIYVFMRIHGIDTATYGYRISEDNGVTWKNEREILDTNSVIYRMYAVFGNVTTYNGHYILPFTYDLDNRTNSLRSGAYYAYFDLTTSKCYSVAGTDLGTEIYGWSEINQTEIMNRYNQTSNPTALRFSQDNVFVVVNLGTADLRSAPTGNANFETPYFTWNGATWTRHSSIFANHFWLNSYVLFGTASNITMFTQNNSASSGNPYTTVNHWHYDGNSWTKIATIAQHSETLFPTDPQFYCWFFVGDGGAVRGGESQTMVFVGEYFENDMTRFGIYGVTSGGGFGWITNGTNIQYTPTVAPAPPVNPSILLPILMIGGIVSIAAVILYNQEERTLLNLIMLSLCIIIVAVLIPVALVLGV